MNGFQTMHLVVLTFAVRIRGWP